MIIDLSLWLSFVGTVLLLVLTPGPSVLLAVANGMKYGTRKTMGTILGDLSANLIQMTLAAAGLATLITSTGSLFQWIKYAGVAYLVYMGIKKLRAKPGSTISKEQIAGRGFLQLYAEGFLMSAANPKAIVFFAALFPLFLNPATALIPQMLVLSVTFLLLDGSSLWLYARFATRLKSYLENKRQQQLQNKIVGSLLILSGLLLSRVKVISE